MKKKAIALLIAMGSIGAWAPMVPNAPSIVAAAATLDVDLSTIIIKSETAASEKALIEEADVIVYGWFDSADQETPTGRAVPGAQGRMFVNFQQTFHVEKRLKGEPKQLLRVLSTGVEPMADGGDPLNHAYTGPLIEGEYICFLTQIGGSGLYRLAAGWQGVYPVHGGKTIALEDEGFPQLGGLTVEQMERRVRAR
ncbi:hypothetical protein [Paenibacillus soyae]|uniref:Uncharacterized protein n=1 Tax=Paenibacillus soyae TaxID=2969249 RepID=A0A9X2MNJ7_9BACL|nr:hypothetical protein [Paenibacillus soyae]MCR2804024.1 hypothetical protein [Paenibacillus soyae]